LSGGTLQDFIKENENIAELQKLNVLHQILSALKYLKKNKIIHGDIKPSNIVFTNSSKT